MWRKFILGLLLAAAACQTGPTQRYILGDVLLKDDFSQPYNWEAFSQQNVQIGVNDGVYEMRSDVRQYVRGFHNQKQSDVVIEVKARQLSLYETNAYGVVCRATSNDIANGYYFLIGGDGSYSIRRGADGDVNALVSWARTGAVNKGPSLNVIQAVCVGDYLALYVNDQFLAETHDSSFKTGYTGFAVAVTENKQIDVTFDDLTIWAASLAGK